jgi:hypothetical protein
VKGGCHMLTKKQALADFRETVQPTIPKLPNGRLDTIWLREAWNNYTDALQKERKITRHQCDTWDNPF